MQIVTNKSATIVYLLAAFAPLGKPIALMPGDPGESTEYDFDAFEQKRPSAARLLREGYVNVTEKPADARVEAPTPAPASRRAPKAETKAEIKPPRTDEYAALSVAEALELIAIETNLDELRKWIGVEDRAELREAIDKRGNALASAAG